MKKYKKSREKVIAMLTFLCVLIVPIKKNSWVQNLFVWNHYARYFQTKVIGVPFSKKQAVFGIIPHGIVPLTLGKLRLRLRFSKQTLKSTIEYFINSIHYSY